MARICRVLIPLVAVGLLSACTVSKTESPALTGPSGLGLSLNVTANPDILPQDASQSQVMVLALDANGQTIKGLPVHLSMTMWIVDQSGNLLPAAPYGSLSASDVTTGNDGRAAVSYTAPPLPPDNKEATLTITAVPVSTDYSSAMPRSVRIRLVLPATLPQLPVANFTYAPAQPTPNAPVAFDGTSSVSPVGSIVGWAWDFGDGGTGSGATVQHVFRAQGSYDVQLRVTDNSGRTSASPARQTVSVSAAAAPKAAFVFSPTTPAPGQTVFFNAATSTAGTGRAIVDYAWDFGNGVTKHGISASTSFTSVLTYSVSLTVTDDLGQTNSTTQPVTVK